MNALRVRHVSAWIDKPRRDEVVAQALDWAARLAVPLRGIAQARRPADAPNGRPGFSTDLGPLREQCEARGVSLDAVLWHGDGDAGMRRLLRPAAMNVVSADVAGASRELLLAESLSVPDTFLLLCPPCGRPAGRALIVCLDGEPRQGFLGAAARLCQVLGVPPVVLIVAATEREAQARCGFVAGLFAHYRLPAEFDIILGSDVATAVRCVARWRDCSHVLLERRRLSLWRRWTQGDLVARLTPVAESLTILAIPERAGHEPDTNNGANGRRDQDRDRPKRAE